MAIYHFAAQIISRVSDRGTLRSVVAAAAYRSGERLYDEKYLSYKYYSRRIAPETFLLYPNNAPEWAKNRESLWNTVEKFEKNYNAQLAREINIALPKELPEQEQRNLVLEFCQKNFVDRGMVADIAIHRDKEDNPHFHVMLTLRKIDEKGMFMPKCRKEYILDANGNKIILPSGEYKSHRVNLTNWNDKETLKEWRVNWQDITNRYLEKNGIDEKISCLSYENQNITLCPTIHEGPQIHQASIENRRTEIGEQNKQIRSYNQTVVELEKYKQAKLEKENQRIMRCFTPGEKQQLIDAARTLRFYVNKDNLDMRIKQLSKWEKSHFYHQGDFKQFSRILMEKQTIESIRDVLQKEAARFCEKYYVGLDALPDEKIEIVERTVSTGTLLNQENIKQLKIEHRENLFRELSSRLLKDGNVFWLDAIRLIESEERRAGENLGVPVLAQSVQKVDSAKGQYHIYQDKITAQCFIGCQQNKDFVSKVTDYMNLKEAHTALLAHAKGIEELPALHTNYSIEKVERLEEALCVMDKLYDEYIYSKYGAAVAVEKLSIPQKELIIHYEEYFGQIYQPEASSPIIYTTREKEEIIGYLLSGNQEWLQERYPQFKSNNMYLNIFVLDCMSDDKLDSRYKENIRAFALGDKNPHDEDFFRGKSPKFIIGQLINAVSTTSNHALSDRDSQMTNRINNRRKKSRAYQEIQQDQGII